MITGINQDWITGAPDSSLRSLTLSTRPPAVAACLPAANILKKLGGLQERAPPCGYAKSHKIFRTMKVDKPTLNPIQRPTSPTDVRQFPVPRALFEPTPPGFRHSKKIKDKNKICVQLLELSLDLMKINIDQEIALEYLEQKTERYDY